MSFFSAASKDRKSMDSNWPSSNLACDHYQTQSGHQHNLPQQYQKEQHLYQPPQPQRHFPPHQRPQREYQQEDQQQGQQQYHYSSGHTRHPSSQQIASPTQRQSSQSSQLPSPQSPPGSTMQSSIERLPSDLQRNVFRRLDYQSLIHLSTTNRYFNQRISPQRMADANDNAQFVMRAAKDFPQHRPSEKGHDYKPGNFECYVCFRVRSPEHFDMLQPQYAFVDPHGHLVTDRDPIPGTDTQISLRRFCIECGMREGLHAPFDCLTTRTGRDLWVCRCRRIWPKPGCLRCPDCLGDCPLRPKKTNQV